jgi:hypothetical protein
MDRSTYASRSSGELASAISGGGRSVRVIPLRYPQETASRGSTSSSPSWWRAALGKARAMGPLEWTEMALPCVAWVRRYRWKEDFQADLAAGITVGVMLVPQVPRLLRILFCFVRIECPLALGKRVPPNLLSSPMIAKWYKCNFLENCVLERSCS